MSLPAAVTRLTSELPYALRVDLEGYLMSIEAAQLDIYREAGVAADEVSRDEFLFVTGVWRLWSQVDAQRWIVRNSLELASGFGVPAIQAGGVRLSRGSDDVEGLRKLSRDLRRWLHRQELDFVVRADSPRGLLESLQRQDRDGH